ncbi:thiamine biosynthesis protein ThiF [Coriobacterium glomerans PW2]|uniref:Thiamine biosynthesis protein ThiF n=1 Tax=Coriobacterium glomerans (strain ATCC 49209 / DSM 20642 / JCM 10262 / PW2) TaxID=700015 RepID=F2N7A3_CORGP|nr:sulfur carrier protein ThiS adenylyltransferase ThiF [Coriobacterium glomerans]AEB06578.1 thiamine biosynthesis protein ThiF [Coriobacterium glomerans PW2]
MNRAQEVLADRIGREPAERLACARVGIAGLGGLGSNIAVHLVRSGVGALHLVDFDIVDESNLNRQHYFRDHLGMRKTEALAEQLRRINPDVELDLDAARIDADNAVALFADERIVCEAFDKPDAKALLVNALLAEAPQTVVIAASGVAGAGPASEVATRRLSPRFYLCGDGTTDVASGTALFAPHVALCAAQQALVAVRLILGLEQAPA